MRKYSYPKRRYRLKTSFLSSRMATIIIFSALFAGATLLTRFEPTKQKPWTPEMIAKHHAAKAGCREAKRLGLTPAHKGQPGYWPQWDGDDDGISCEWW